MGTGHVAGTLQILIYTREGGRKRKSDPAEASHMRPRHPRVNLETSYPRHRQPSISLVQSDMLRAFMKGYHSGDDTIGDQTPTIFRPHPRSRGMLYEEVSAQVNPRPYLIC